MAADINDKFKKVSADNSYAVATTVKTARTVGGGTTLEAFDLSKWADATAVNFLTYRKTTDPVTNITTVTNRTGWTALVNTSSNTLTNLTVAPGYTDLGHQVGDYIEPVQMSKWANDLVDGILVTHNQDGTLKNKIATLSKINGGSTAGVLTTDASGNVSATSQPFSTLNGSDGSTTSTTYVTIGVTPAGVAVNVGASGRVLIGFGSTAYQSTSGNFCETSIQVSGANTITAGSERRLICTNKQGATGEMPLSKTTLLSGLTPGSTTFQQRFKVNAGTGNFSGNYIWVLAL